MGSNNSWMTSIFRRCYRLNMCSYYLWLFVIRNNSADFISYVNGIKIQNEPIDDVKFDRYYRMHHTTRTPGSIFMPMYEIYNTFSLSIENYFQLSRWEQMNDHHLCGSCSDHSSGCLWYENFALIPKVFKSHMIRLSFFTGPSVQTECANQIV